jgi:hypothetical protein
MRLRIECEFPADERFPELSVLRCLKRIVTGEIEVVGDLMDLNAGWAIVEGDRTVGSVTLRPTEH